MTKLLVWFIVVWTTVAADRNPRYFWFNNYAVITLGIQFRLPLGIALPSLYFNDGRSFNVFNNFNITEENLQDYYWDPNYADQLGRLTNYFAHMEIVSLNCQERVICELAVNPVDFSPVSDLILKEMRQKYGAVDKSANSLMWRYMAAARTGYISAPGDCESIYHGCPIPAHKLLNMPIIKLAQYLMTLMGMEVT